MKKIILAALASTLLAVPVLAQEMRSEVESALQNAGVMVEIPEDATDEQLTQVLALTNAGNLNGSQLEFEVKKALGME